MNTMRVDKFFEEAIAELYRATDMHGHMHSVHEAYAVILEELDEFWDEVKTKVPKEAGPLQRSIHRSRMQRELIHTAAMCCRAVIDLDLDKRE